jgi:hypothetical protein
MIKIDIKFKDLTMVGASTIRLYSWCCGFTLAFRNTVLGLQFFFSNMERNVFLD